MCPLAIYFEFEFLSYTSLAKLVGNNRNSMFLFTIQEHDSNIVYNCRKVSKYVILVIN